MKKENVKPSLTEFGFLRLFLSMTILQNQIPIFENQQLQKDLYAFYDNPNFYFLFEDIAKKESVDENNYVDLERAFYLAYSLGLLTMVQDGGRLKSIINLTKEEAKENVSQFGLRQVGTMCELVVELYSPKKMAKSRILEKK